MNVLLFGATGMVGQGVLRECLQAGDVTRVVVVGRTPTGIRHPKLVEQVRPDLMDLTDIAAELQPFDACFFCLGVSSFRMDEAKYTRLTFDLTLSIAKTLAPLNPQMTFVYVSGASTDSTEQGRSMWARVKGRTENALKRLPFKAVYLFRPGVIQPLHGAHSKTAVYNFVYVLLNPVLTLIRWLRPGAMLTTEDVGLAMLAVARKGAPQAALEVADIRALARQPA
ncbi:MAG: epimerase [Rhizobacter sp.]|nr:epimerase [Rhizobacter sp.]